MLSFPYYIWFHVYIARPESKNQLGVKSVWKTVEGIFNLYGSVHRNNILVYNSSKMHKSQSLFNLTIALHVSGVTITHHQEHKTTVTTPSANRYTVIDRVKFTGKEYR
jgi:hypothetical protein